MEDNDMFAWWTDLQKLIK